MDDAAKPLGFWSCWALTVGTVIGSGIFLLPTVLAPYGLLSYGGWALAGGGALMLALTFARLAGRTTRTGGAYAYIRNSFGDLTGYLNGWALWVSYWIAIPVVALAFVGYLTIFIPGLSASVLGQEAATLTLIWALTFINISGLKEMSVVQITMTLLKIVPFIVVIGLCIVAGKAQNLPPLNPRHETLLSALSATALLTLWPFTGFEVGVTPASNVKDAERTIPRALITGMVTVIVIYLAATTAVMLLVSSDVLVHSTAPFADAARGLGAWGPWLVAVGALIATAGTLNGVIFMCGQMPMAAALDRLAPAAFARTTKSGGPYAALLLSSVLGSLLLLTNFSRGLVGAYTFLLMMSTAVTLLPYFFSALAELRHSWRSARGWALVALLAALYSAFALLGSGLEVLGWGLVLMLTGVPLYFLGKGKKAVSAIA